MLFNLAETANSLLSSWPLPMIRGYHLLAAVLCASALLWNASFQLRAGHALCRLTNQLAFALACLSIVAFGTLMVAYVYAQRFLDHAEPAVVMISYWRRMGHLLYPSWMAGEGFYGLIYGPLLFDLYGLILALGGGIVALKLPGVIAAAIAVLATWRSLRPPGAGFFGPVPVMIMGAFVLILIGFGNIGFWIRPEPFLIMCSALALLCITRLSNLNALIATGVLCGIAVGFKLNAPVYFLAPGLWLLGGPGALNSKLVGLAIAAVCTLTIVIVPFLDPLITFKGYVVYFRMASDHGLDFNHLRYNMLFSALLVLPAIIMFWRRASPSVSAQDLLFSAGYLLGLGAAAVIAGKPGAGPHHLLPLLPAFAFLCHRVAVSVAAERTGLPRLDAGIIFLALSLALVPPVLLQVRAMLGALILNNPIERQKAEEVAALYRASPRAVMGLTSVETYSDTYHRVQGALAGAPAALFELPAWMEMSKADAPDTIVESVVENCTIPAWIMPNKGDPFSLETIYVRNAMEPVFSPRFRHAFLQNYAVSQPGRFYSIWRCSKDQR